jgi:hypothetical protein
MSGSRQTRSFAVRVPFDRNASPRRCPAPRADVIWSKKPSVLIIGPELQRRSALIGKYAALSYQKREPILRIDVYLQSNLSKGENNGIWQRRSTVVDRDPAPHHNSLGSLHAPLNERGQNIRGLGSGRASLPGLSFEFGAGLRGRHRQQFYRSRQFHDHTLSGNAVTPCVTAWSGSRSTFESSALTDGRKSAGPPRPDERVWSLSGKRLKGKENHTDL